MKKILFAIIAVFAIAFVGMVSASPAPLPTGVSGMIFDGSHAGVPGASINVTCLGNTVYATSLSDGSYVADFDAGDCTYSTPVTVTACKTGLGCGSNVKDTCTADDCFIPIALVDVTIPEFGLIGGMLAVLGVLGVVVYKRNN